MSLVALSGVFDDEGEAGPGFEVGRHLVRDCLHEDIAMECRSRAFSVKQDALYSSLLCQ